MSIAVACFGFFVGSVCAVGAYLLQTQDREQAGPGPLFVLGMGVVGFFVGLVYTVWIQDRATRYEKALRAYKQRKEEIMGQGP
jgi:hypothetical protein